MEMNVLVYKQNIPVASGESIDDFTRKLNQAAREHTVVKLNIKKDGNGGAWGVEYYSDRVIMSTYGEKSSHKYYMIKYNRNKDGSFEFGDMIEVERKITWSPKTNSTNSIMKDTSSNSLATSEKGCGGIKTRKMLGEPIEFNGWIETAKSFWTGVL